MSATPFDFGRVIAPVTRSDFFAAYYERAPLVIHRNQPDYYADLLDLDTVIAQIETCALKADEIHLVKFGETQNAEDWLGADRRADPIRVLRMVEAGWTVALNKMHLRLPALAKLCQAAEAEFSAAFQTNLYLTPPGAQGFKPHWDTHDVFVLQVHGSKDWVLYDTKVELPLSGQAFESANDTPGPVSRSVTLHAGDILYCQRGLMHAAHSTDETSLHITFGLMAKTWADLMLEAVGGAVLAAPRLRRNLPVGFARPGTPVAAFEAEFQELFALLMQHTEAAPVLAQFRDQFIASRLPRLEGQWRQLAEARVLAPESRVGARPALIFHAALEDDTFTVSHGTNQLNLPAYTHEAVLFALSTASFAVRELPGPLDEPSKITLVRRLIGEGLVQILSP